LVKEGDHAFLFNYVNAASEAGQTIAYEHQDGKVLHRYRFINQVPLNESHQEVLVNFLEYWEIEGDKVSHFSCASRTDLTLTKWTLYPVMRGGRARWKIENETFNTLKNQGYHFEHNYGPGEKYLSVNFAALMMLAFLIDQIQQQKP
jgi:hypothetical protein